MAVINAIGFEAQQLATDGLYSLTGTAAYSTAQHRTGAASLRCNPASGANGFAYLPSDDNYVHFGFYIASLPSVTRIISGGSTSCIQVKLTSGGNLAVYLGATLIGTSSLALSTATWYWIGIRQTTGTSVVWLQIDGADAVTGTATSTPATAIGCYSAEASAIDIYIDDVITTGSGFLAPSKVGLAVPISDNAGGTGWTLGTGTALGGNGYAAVDSKPPVGVADLAAGSDVKQIRNASANANVNYDANLQTYTTVGVGASDTILAVRPVVATAAPVSTSAKAGTIGCASNPAIANINLGAGGTSGAFWSGAAGGTYPTGWKVSWGTLTASPSVTLGTSPVLRITQVTSSTRIAVVAFMGLLVVWTPATGFARSQGVIIT